MFDGFHRMGIIYSCFVLLNISAGKQINSSDLKCGICS